MLEVFTTADRVRLLSRIGYGNVAGPLWFLGMEEALKSKIVSNLRWRLENLDLNSTQITDEALVHIAKNPSLERLVISNSEISELIKRKMNFFIV